MHSSGLPRASTRVPLSCSTAEWRLWMASAAPAAGQNGRGSTCHHRRCRATGGRRLWLQSRSRAKRAGLRFPRCCAPAADAAGGGARPDPDQDPLTVHLVQHRHEAQPARGGDPERAPHGPPPRPPACATRPRVGCLRERGSKGVKRPRAVVRMGGGLSEKVALRAPARPPQLCQRGSQCVVSRRHCFFWVPRTRAARG